MPGSTDSDLPRADHGAAFQATHWSVVLSASDPSSPLAAEALNTLCQTYWYPIYAYLRRDGKDQETAKDLTQEFFARLLSLNSLAQVRREKGKFRNFLLASLKHLLFEEQKKAGALKRGGGQLPISLDDPAGEHRYQHEPATNLDPEKLYERRWALTLLAQALARLQAEYDNRNKAALFERLVARLDGDREAPPYVEVAAEFGMTVQAVKNAVFELRRRHSQLVREEAANTVGSPEEVDEELRHLIDAVSG